MSVFRPGIDTVPRFYFSGCTLPEDSDMVSGASYPSLMFGLDDCTRDRILCVGVSMSRIL